ncbi:hypothetical protein T440DRAFT_361075, partial [Plenodomus tracheiphilus IPT5]
LVSSLSPHERLRKLRTAAKAVVEAWKNEFNRFSDSRQSRLSWDKAAGRCPDLPDLPPHEHIIDCLGYIMEHPFFDKVSIFFEYCPMGNLFDTHA